MEDITTVKVTPGFGDMEKINEIYTEAFPPEERKFSLSQMLEAPIFKSDMNAYYYNGKIIGLSVVMNLKTFVYGLFLAIDKTERSRGYGGKVVDKLIRDCGDAPFVFSIEDPSEECDNKEQRIRREAFYFKHNCFYAGYKGRYPGNDSCFCLMCSRKLDDYSFIENAIAEVNPELASMLEKY